LENTLRERLRRGWEASRAITTPPASRGPSSSRQFVSTTPC
jgi:hypothetical protein